MRGPLVLAGYLLALFAAALVAGAPALWAAPAFPKPTGYVNDFAHLLEPQARDSLDRRLAEYDRTTGDQIAVAIFPDLGGVPINEFASRLEEAWKVGRRGKDNGLLLLVGVKERQVRIEVGYGLEPKVTDGDAGAIIRNILAPAFRAGRYADGLNAAVDELIRLIGAPPGASPPSTVGSRPRRAVTRSPLELLVPFLGFLVFILLSVGLYRMAGPRCPRDGIRLRLQQTATAVGGRRITMWVCPRCGYQEKAVGQAGPMWAGPLVVGGGWGSGGFSGGGGGGDGGFGGFGGGSSGGGGASGGW